METDVNELKMMEMDMNRNKVEMLWKWCENVPLKSIEKVLQMCVKGYLRGKRFLIFISLIYLFSFIRSNENLI